MRSRAVVVAALVVGLVAPMGSAAQAGAGAARPTTAASASRTSGATPPAPVSNARWFRAATIDLLGARPSEAAVTAVGARLATGTSRATVARELARSQAWTDAVVTELYRDVLGREPDAAWPRLLVRAHPGRHPGGRCGRLDLLLGRALRRGRRHPRRLRRRPLRGDPPPPAPTPAGAPTGWAPSRRPAPLADVEVVLPLGRGARRPGRCPVRHPAGPGRRAGRPRLLDRPAGRRRRHRAGRGARRLARVPRPLVGSLRHRRPRRGGRPAAVRVLQHPALRGRVGRGHLHRHPRRLGADRLGCHLRRIGPPDRRAAGQAGGHGHPVLRPELRVVPPSVSDDGRYVAMADWGVALVDRWDETTERIGPQGWDAADRGRDPALSPDGSTVAYHQVVGGVAQVVVHDVAAGTTTPITAGNGPSTAARLSGDGNLVVVHLGGHRPGGRGRQRPARRLPPRPRRRHHRPGHRRRRAQRPAVDQRRRHPAWPSPRRRPTWWPTTPATTAPPSTPTCGPRPTAASSGSPTAPPRPTAPRSPATVASSPGPSPSPRAVPPTPWRGTGRRVRSSGSTTAPPAPTGPCGRPR